MSLGKTSQGGYMAWLEWWNFMFIAPLGAGIVMAVLVVFSGTFSSDSGGHGHGEAADTADHHGHFDGDHGKSFDLFGWFGIGRGVSISVMLPILLAGWGLTGFLSNLILEPTLRYPQLFTAISVILAFLGSSFIGRNFAQGFIQFADQNRKTNIQSAELVGCFGSSVFEISKDGGAANIKDPFGNIHRVSVISRGESIQANKAVRVLEYQRGVYVVQEEVND
jgi:Protein of unknown function (DUF1449)